MSTRRRSPPESAIDRRVAHMGDAEFGEQLLDHRFEAAGIRLDQLGGGADVLLGGEAAEDRGFLRQIADAEPGAAVHRQARDVVAVELDGAAFRA